MRKPLVVFKWEGEEDDGTPHRPLWIMHFEGDSPDPVREEAFDRWFTLPEARQLAEERGYDFQDDA
jgi:hypothetical protein